MAEQKKSYPMGEQDKTTVTTKAQLKTFGRTRPAHGRYSLDLSVLKDASVTVNGEPSTFDDAYGKLSDAKIEEMPIMSRGRYATDKGDLELGGDWPILSTLKTLAELMQQGIDPYRVMWFYFDHDWSRDGDESYSFFAAYNDKIVVEHCHFSSLEPMILKQEKDDEPIWQSHRYFDEALERYWYRRFYEETMTGKLMVLRPDEPILFHFERPRTKDVMKEIQVVTLVKLYRLLWVTVPLLVAIAFPSIREYMAVVAAVLGIDVLWRWWATRKVGQS